MKDFNLQKYLRENPLTQQKKVLSKGKINEAFDGFGGMGDIAKIGVGKIASPHGWTGDEGQPEGVNTWIADIDRMPEVDGWKASWEYPGVIAWNHPEVPTAQVVATPGWDGKGTPVEFQSEAGSIQMLKVLDQDEFRTFKDYVRAIKPYLDMVLKANSNDVDQQEFEENYMGTSYDSSEDMAVDMAKKGITENDYFDRRKSDDKSMTAYKGWQWDDDDDDDFDPKQSSSSERMEGLINQRELAKFGEAVMAIAQDLEDDGFDAEDIKAFLIKKLDGMIIA